MELSEKIQQLRKAKGLTQEELAEKLFVSRTAVSKWESGRGYPGIDSLKAIAAFFSVTVDELISGEELTIDEYTVLFDNPRNYTLLAVKRDRFTWMVLLGGLAILAGLVLAFWLQPRAIWAVREENGWHLYGLNRKGGVLFRDEFLKAAAEAGSRPVAQENTEGGDA